MPMQGLNAVASLAGKSLPWKAFHACLTGMVFSLTVLVPVFNLIMVGALLLVVVQVLPWSLQSPMAWLLVLALLLLVVGAGSYKVRVFRKEPAWWKRWIFGLATPVGLIAAVVAASRWGGALAPGVLATGLLVVASLVLCGVFSVYNRVRPWALHVGGLAVCCMLLCWFGLLWQAWQGPEAGGSACGGVDQVRCSLVATAQATVQLVLMAYHMTQASWLALQLCGAGCLVLILGIAVFRQGTRTELRAAWSALLLVSSSIWFFVILTMSVWGVGLPYLVDLLPDVIYTPPIEGLGLRTGTIDELVGDRLQPIFVSFASQLIYLLVLAAGLTWAYLP
jgi:hypothetical protein